MYVIDASVTMTVAPGGSIVVPSTLQTVTVGTAADSGYPIISASMKLNP